MEKRQRDRITPSSERNLRYVIHQTASRILAGHGDRRAQLGQLFLLDVMVASMRTWKPASFRRLSAFSASTVMAALVVSGCSAATPAPESPVTSTSIERKSWRPGQPVRDLPTMAEEEKLALRESALADHARSLDISDPPEVALVRWIRTDEQGPSAEACLAEAGFTVESDSSGQGWRLVSQIAAEQAHAFHLASYTCTAQYFVDPAMMQSLTSDQLRVLYEYHVEVSIPCLAKLGYPRPEPPSLETFLGTFDTDPWLPVKNIGLDLSGGDEVDRVLEACEQSPPVAALYGE